MRGYTNPVALVMKQSIPIQSAANCGTLFGFLRSISNATKRLTANTNASTSTDDISSAERIIERVGFPERLAMTDGAQWRDSCASTRRDAERCSVGRLVVLPHRTMGGISPSNIFLIAVTATSRTHS